MPFTWFCDVNPRGHICCECCFPCDALCDGDCWEDRRQLWNQCTNSVLCLSLSPCPKVMLVCVVSHSLGSCQFSCVFCAAAWGTMAACWNSYCFLQGCIFYEKSLTSLFRKLCLIQAFSSVDGDVKYLSEGILVKWFTVQRISEFFPYIYVFNSQKKESRLNFAWHLKSYLSKF